MRTNEVVKLLRTRYCAPEWAFLEQVADKTGFDSKRFADAVAMSLYPSRGIYLHGFEVKVSRSDWVKELKTPDKAECICRFCDFWWIVTGDPGIVKDGELPENWGLLEAKGGKLYTKIKAPRLQSEPLPKTFLASILRRATEQISEEAIRKEIWEEAVKSGREEGRTRQEQLSRREKERVAEFRKKVALFQEASGINIEHAWDVEGLGKRVKDALAKDHSDLNDRLKSIKSAAKSVIEMIDATGVA